MANTQNSGIVEIDPQSFHSMIYVFRGQQVMLDRDLARMYGVDTRVLNQAVKRNMERFPERFMFQLSKDEFENWKSQIVISNMMSQSEIDSFKMAVRRAWNYVSQLVRSARQRIVLIDNYVDERVLILLTKREKGVSATIHSRYTEQFKVDIEKHNEQYDQIEFVQLPHKSHDRFLIIDDSVYLMGASVKDMGTSLCAINKMEMNPEVILSLLK